jgi:hypothetical protein
MKQPRTVSWSVTDECRFLDSCGRGVFDKASALRGYLLAQPPDHWSQEDETTLKRYAERLLRGVK